MVGLEEGLRGRGDRQREGKKATRLVKRLYRGRQGRITNTKEGKVGKKKMTAPKTYTTDRAGIWTGKTDHRAGACLVRN